MTSHSITSRIIASDVIFTCNSCSRLMPAHVKCPRTEDHRPDAEFRAKDPERKRWKIDLEKPELGRFLFKDCPKCASIRQTAKRRKENVCERRKKAETISVGRGNLGRKSETKHVVPHSGSPPSI